MTGLSFLYLGYNRVLLFLSFCRAMDLELPLGGATRLVDVRLCCIKQLSLDYSPKKREKNDLCIVCERGHGGRGAAKVNF